MTVVSDRLRKIMTMTMVMIVTSVLVGVLYRRMGVRLMILLLTSKKVSQFEELS